jgi:DNA-binding LytR/AlgR family response regulator
MFMKIAICDDSPYEGNRLYEAIVSNASFSDSEIDLYTSSAEMLKVIEKNPQYDVAFLDVDMPEINGIELGKKLKEQNPKTDIVFVTNYPQYAIDAYDCEAFHYLLKPLDIQKANDVLQRLLVRYRERHKYYSIKIKTDTIRLPITDIYIVECCQKHIIYHTENKKYQTLGSLYDAYSILKNYGFLQVHQGYIVNMDKISYFEKYEIFLCNGKSVPISVRKRSEVTAAYAKYVKEH